MIVIVRELTKNKDGERKPMPTKDCPNLVREIRKRLGISQEQLARGLGISFQTVNQWENAKANPLQMGEKAAQG